MSDIVSLKDWDHQTVSILQDRPWPKSLSPARATNAPRHHVYNDQSGCAHMAIRDSREKGQESSKRGDQSVEGRLASQMETIILTRLAADRLVVPALPAAALKCIRLLKDPEMSLKAAAAVIEQDPVLAAGLIHLSNSVALATVEPVKSVLAAVTKIGTSKLKTFLFEASANQLFESHDERIARSCRAVWEHSLAVAILAKDVVTLANAGDPDAAYLGGLLHDVGKPIVASLLLQAERTVTQQRAQGGWIDSARWTRVIASAHRKVGMALAKRWELPDAVTKCIQSCDDYDVADRLSVVNAVRFANALAKREGLYLGEVDSSDNDALIMIGGSLLGLDRDIVERVTKSLQGRVERQLS
jgi:putative nucleotidyltransferase with HDIG domain